MIAGGLDFRQWLHSWRRHRFFENEVIAGRLDFRQSLNSRRNFFQNRVIVGSLDFRQSRHSQRILWKLSDCRKLSSDSCRPASNLHASLISVGGKYLRRASQSMKAKTRNVVVNVHPLYGVPMSDNMQNRGGEESIFPFSNVLTGILLLVARECNFHPYWHLSCVVLTLCTMPVYG